MRRRPTKYRAVRTTVDGVEFASKREAAVYRDLRLRVLAGEITDLELQPRFPLTVHGVKVCTYVADFEWQEDGARIIADVKGVKTALYRLKKKLVRAIYGVDILEMA
jgi:hypothetical protein